MKNLSLAIRNGFWNALGNATGLIAGIISSILVVRNLLPKEYGEFSYYMWLSSIFINIGSLAFPISLTKISAELRGGQQRTEAGYLSHVVALGLVGLNLLLGIGICLWSLQKPLQGRIFLFVIAAVLVPNAVTAVLRSTLWGREQYKAVSKIIIASSIVQLICTFLVFILVPSVLGFVLAILTTNIAQCVGIIFLFRHSIYMMRLERLLKLPSQNTVRRYIYFAAPATLLSVFDTVIWQRSEIFFLERSSTLEQVGFYSLSYTVFSMMLLFGWSLVNGFYPAISHDYGARAWEQISEKMQQGLIIAALFAAPLSLGGWITMERLITLLYGPKMLPAAPVAQILFLGLLPGVCAAMFSLLFSAAGKIWISVWISIVISIFSISLDILFIPRFGAFGAAIANTSAQIAFVIIQLICVRYCFAIRIPWRAIGNLIIIGIMTTFILPALIQIYLPGEFGLIGAILTAGCLYLLLIWHLGFIQPLRTMGIAK